MHVMFDGLNIKRGGGVTILKRLLDAFHEIDIKTTVLLSAREVMDIIKEECPATEIQFREDLSSVRRASLFRHFKLKAFCDDFNVDVIFGFNYWSPVPTKQVTYHVNVIPFLEFKQRVTFVGVVRAILQRFYSMQAVGRSHLNIFESQHIMDLANTQYKSIVNPVVKYIGVDGAPVTKGVVQVQNRIIAVTSGNRHKRNDLLISLHRVLNSRTDIQPVELVIGGFGAEDAIRRQLGKEDSFYIDSCDNIRFLGYCPRDELYREIQGSLALVTFSELESFFMVALEAMTVGCPVIAGRISSAQESIGNAGLLVNHGDVEAAAEHVVSLLNPVHRKAQSEKGLAWAARFRSDECARDIVTQVVASFPLQSN